MRDYLIKKHLHYKQGQYVNKIRQYFYYIDHNGYLFLDDARMKNFTSCFKDTRFLSFFFSRLRLNKGDYREHFPFVSPCGLEENFVRCDDRPIVFTGLDEERQRWQLNFSTRGVDFQPEKLCMHSNGRLYHPAPLADFGLVRSQLADRFFPNFEFDTDGQPTHFNWKGRRIELTNELLAFDTKSEDSH